MKKKQSRTRLANATCLYAISRAFMAFSMLPLLISLKTISRIIYNIYLYNYLQDLSVRLYQEI